MIEGNQVLTKVFACGVGFPVRTKDGSGVELNPFKNPRADQPVKDVLLMDSWLQDKPFSDIFAVTLKSSDTLDASPRANQ